jgi:Holliday junction resolvase RusA-like endonuclease
MVYRCTIPLAPVSMKNRRRIVLHRGRWRSVKSDRALAYVEVAVPCMTAAIPAGVPRPMFPRGARLLVMIRATYPNNRPDLDVEIVYDCLEKAGVIHNDRQVWGKQSLKVLGPAQTEVTVTNLEEFRWAANSLWGTTS